MTIDTAGKPGAAASGVDESCERIPGHRHRRTVEQGLGNCGGEGGRAGGDTHDLAVGARRLFFRPVRRWIFSTAHPVSLAVRRTLSHMRMKGYQRAAVLVSDDGFGAEGRESLSEMAPEMGISVLLNNRHRENEHNLLPYLQKAHVRGAEAFIHWAQGPSRLALARARLALDIRLPIYMALVSSRALKLKNPGKPLNGAVFPASRVLAADLLPKGSPGLESIQAFRVAFWNRFGHYPDGISGSAADALRIIEASLGRGDLRREQIRRNIEKMAPFEGLTGAFYLSKSDHNGLRADSLVMVRILNEKWRLDSEKPGKAGKSTKKK